MQEKNQRVIKDDYVHLEDLALKAAAQFFGDELLPYVGVTEKIVRAAPTETVHLEARKMYEDFNFEMGNGWWYHFEFESDSITINDLKRFREYEASTSRIYDVPVVTGVICSSKVQKLLSEFTEGINTYKVQVFRVKDKNADQLFQKLNCEKCISRKDIIPILLSPLMSGDMNIKDRIIKGMKVVQSADYILNREEAGKMQAVLYAFANKFLDNTELKEVKEAVLMTRLGQMIWEDGVERGVEQGIEQGIAALIEDNLEENKDKEQICAKLMKRFSLNSEDAEVYYRKFAKL